MLTDKSGCRNVVIVGGGPSGLAIALMLAKRGWTEITVLEKRKTADYYEPDKAFNYQIDGRGQKLLDWLGLTPNLAEISVSSQEFYLTLIQPNGKRKTIKLPFINPNRKTAYWLPRRTFVSLLYEEIERNWQQQITVLFEAKCIELKQKQEQLQVIVESKNSELMSFTPGFVVGCDGLNSIVRQTLNDWEKPDHHRFEMQYFPSASSGLRYQVLTLPPQFPLSNQLDDQSVCTMAYAIRGKTVEGQKKISLGLLPMKNPDEPRTANIITYPNHKIWTLKTNEELYRFLEQSFPQLSIRDIISESEITRFVNSQGGVFPVPQFCSGLHFLLKSDQTFSAILLLGDAVHCFPPDIGQGVNSALEDVYILQQVLEETQDDLLLALPLYEARRSGDIEALIHLAQTTFPWQYNQNWFRRKLWDINFLIGLLLNRFLPFFFSPPAFLMIQDYQLSYQEIWHQNQRTNQRLFIFSVTLLGILFVLGFSFNV
ncbi:Kynurenine 3-monooxygenase [Planktothrix tepida]|uniref:FAD-binding domain-containing protein n=1 Tax=Planktothrix tepida PCC 9214 TaxID=671072 RepID=A0A1J1LKM8_9CYAN|nr:NAD(P)/FAD-dependent oxidoreductase [Planktothrix tepida]CAD5953271.1 Kynurenine 3-monooxygenase [Planktothrix tepida]CUR32742.1 conserved hypothetical protein [Planktothrix tepida PCC 9214]